MALEKTHKDTIAELIQQAAASVAQENPEMVAPPSLSDATLVQLAEDDRELERLWDALDVHEGTEPSTYTTLDALCEDRGER